MNGVTDDGVARSYISSHSADVILSDIRPTKLTADALRSINVFLDEVLYQLLTTADSLSTDKIRAALLKILPTSLGKEALLEAEVELRAYWDRTNRPVVGTSKVEAEEWTVFNLRWAFELLRYKCEAFSTLNEIEEVPNGETKLKEKMGSVAGPPKALVAPAALYLTAIIEAICEHILSNIGRVAARDSSRTSATTQDLFVALCEDDSIYTLFKSMKVFNQIETLSRVARPGRSKSLSRGSERPQSFPRTSSPQDSASVHSLKNRTSVETGAIPVPTSTLTSPNSINRTSNEKARAMKMFIANSKVSSETHTSTAENAAQHQRSISSISDEAKQVLANYDYTDGSFTDEDATLVAEFDDLMRSSSTMKVSLTPDRLKTMELYRKEKNLRDQKRAPPPLTWNENSSDGLPVAAPPQRATGRRPSLLQVAASIHEGDEEDLTINTGSKQTPAPRSAPAHSNTATATLQTRMRSSSAATQVLPLPTKILPPSLRSSSSVAQIDQLRSKLGDSTLNHLQHKPGIRESIDLDDIDDFGEDGRLIYETPRHFPWGTKSGDQTPERKVNDNLSPRENQAVSTPARDLISFLSEGPPSDNLPPSKIVVSLDNGHKRPTSGSRLKRMISKLSITSDKSLKTNRDSSNQKSGSRTSRPDSPKTSASMAGLANNPIPPRPPRPISPPSSSSAHSLEVLPQTTPPQLRQSPPSRKTQERPIGIVESPDETCFYQKSDGFMNGNGRANSSPNEDAEKVNHLRNSNSLSDTGSPMTEKQTRSNSPTALLPTRLDIPSGSPRPPRPEMSPARRSKPLKSELPSSHSPTSPSLYLADIEALRRLIANATTADECRLIFGIYLPKSTNGQNQTDFDVPYPSPTPSPAMQTQCPEDEAGLETAVLELFLGA